MKTTWFCLLVATMPYTLFANADDLERGVTWELAQQRKSAIADLEYDLSMDLVAQGAISASVRITFDLQSNKAPLILDFGAPAKNIRGVQLNQTEIEYEVRAGHIVIPAEPLQLGKQTVDIRFIAGEPSLNRNEKFLYTLLVPDRASSVFPCFDQPDLKASFRLQLDLPNNWTASANGSLESKEDLANGKSRLQFGKTLPVSTYLFAFAAGEFQTITREVRGRTMTMFHRETDDEKVRRNVDAIFFTHALALEWMEKYTQIEYPFEKFSFVLIPSFQYGGMEHIGNIFYNADALFLDESATQQQKLDRASLIAHETAHMWFGNLVTMKWFDDVWLKEVFANFMAAKIVHPSFPNINHDLGFMLKHHPSAYGEDRSQGTYPIQQKLDNLRNAGTLYGRIIYMKAPIVMRQLETMIGPRELQTGLQEYLTTFRFGNAVWDDLIDILDRQNDVDLKQWSEAWVKEAGTPEIESELKGSVLALKQTRRTAADRYWSQQVDIKIVAAGNDLKTVRATVVGENTEIAIPDLRADYDFYLANGSELGYGYFQLDDKSLAFLLDHVQEVEDDVTRGAAWLALYESLVRGAIQPDQFLRTLQAGIEVETEPLNRQNILSQLDVVFWKFLTREQRLQSGPNVEAALWRWIESDIANDARSAYYKTLVHIANSQSTIDRLYQLWEKQSDVHGLTLAEADFVTLAQELALRMPDRAAEILQTQHQRLKNEDRRQRFAFVEPSLSPDPKTRDEFFASLSRAENRRPERWVLDGLNYLHHPLRASSSEKYILPSLTMLEEIQQTGDIFFPKRWLLATFSGHRSKSAATIVTQFLADHPEYPVNLRNKILQAADLLLKIGLK